VFLFLAVAVGLPDTARAGHKPREMSCGECHSVSGAPGAVVTNSQLIKNDEQIAQFQGAGWSAGDEIPCVYCHRDQTGIRTNMVGVKRHFETTKSRHDVEQLVSNQTDADRFDCVDCHDVTQVAYVGQGSTPGDTLNPNIHNVDAQAYGRTEGIGGLNVSSTFLTSPYNAQGNALCYDCTSAVPPRAATETTTAATTPT
jgi:hypothetical protein